MLGPPTPGQTKDADVSRLTQRLDSVPRPLPARSRVLWEVIAGVLDHCDDRVAIQERADREIASIPETAIGLGGAGRARHDLGYSGNVIGNHHVHSAVSERSLARYTRLRSR